jgi:hypothetical protein
MRVGANTAATAASFWKGKLRELIFTEPLSDTEAAAMWTRTLPLRELALVPMVDFEAILNDGAGTNTGTPAGTPPSVITKLNKAILQAMKNPELIKKLDESGAIAIPGTPAEFATQIQQAIDRYQRIAKIAKIQID